MTAEEMIRVGKQFATQNPRFEENQHNVDLMIAAFKVVKRHRPEVEWSVATLEELFLDLLPQGRITAKPLEAPTQKATPAASASPAPTKHLRTADALPVARENARRAERERIARENSEQAKAERRALNKRLATALIDNWSSAELAARADAELDKALAGELDTHVLDIRAAKYAAPVETIRPHGGGNFWSANAIAASQNAAHAEQRRIKGQFERGRIEVRGASSHGVGASTYSLERDRK